MNDLKPIVLDESVYYSLTEVCEVCSHTEQWIVALVEEGIVQPSDPAENDWRFSGPAVHRAMRARRLQKDLELNLAGVALALDLLDEIESLRSRLGALEFGD